MRTSSEKRRRGVASLEFVMQLPFLLAIAAMTATVGFASLGKSTAVLQARHEVWKLRDDPTASSSSLAIKEYDQGKFRPLSVLDAAGLGQSGLDEVGSQGEIYGEARRTVEIFPWLGGPVDAQGRAAVLAGSWDHKDVPEFEEQDAPHLGIADRMAGGDGTIGNVMGAVVAFLLRGGLKSAVQSDEDVQQAKKDADEAEEKAEEAKKKVDEEIKKMEVERDKTIVLRDQKVIDRDNKVIERNEHQTELGELLKKSPKTDADKARIQWLKDEIGKLNAAITKLNTDIAALNKKIKQLQDAIDEANAAREEHGV